MSTYYALYIRCPACLYEGRTPGPPAYWYHTDCGGRLDVSDDAVYRCNKCGFTSHISSWRYSCKNHGGIFRQTSSNHFASSVSVSGQLTNLAGRAWLYRLLDKLGDW